MRAPACDAGGRKERGEQFVRDAQHPVDETRVHVHVCTHGLAPFEFLIEHFDAHALDALHEVKLLVVAGLDRHVVGVLLQKDGAGVVQGVDRVAQAVDLAGAVARLLVTHEAQIVGHGAVALRVGGVLPDVREHLHDLLVGAAMQRALQRGDRAGDRAVGVGAGGGQHAAGKGRVVAAAVLGMQGEHQVQKVRLFRGKLIVPAQHVQEVLRQRHVLLRHVQVERLSIVIVLLGGVGVGHNDRKARRQFHRLAHDVFNGRVVRVGVIGIEREHRAGELVHDVFAGRL